MDALAIARSWLQVLLEGACTKKLSRDLQRGKNCNSSSQLKRKCHVINYGKFFELRQTDWQMVGNDRFYAKNNSMRDICKCRKNSLTARPPAKWETDQTQCSSTFVLTVTDGKRTTNCTPLYTSLCILLWLQLWNFIMRQLNFNSFFAS